MNESQLTVPPTPRFSSLAAGRERFAAFLERESWIKLVPAILVAAIILSEIQWSTPNIIGVDGYYHIKVAEVMRQAGVPAPIYFPWLQLTILNPAQFTDHHLLFHILLEPFTLLDLRVGAKLAGATFASLAVLTIYGLMAWQKVRWSFLWLLLLIGLSGAFLYRLSMTRRQSMVLLLLVLLIVVAFARRDRLALVVGFVFSWVYDGFLLFIAVAGLLSIGRWAGDGLFGVAWQGLGAITRGERRWAGWQGIWRWAIAQRRQFALVGFASAGVILGLLIHPYSPRSLTFAIEHAVPKLVPAGDFVVGVGNEWYPYAPSALWRATGASLVAVCLGFIPILASLRFQRRWDGRVIALALLALFFTALLLRSRRFVEYQPAVALLFCAFAWSFQWPGEVRDWFARRLPYWTNAVVWVLVLVGAVLLMRPTIVSAQNSARASRPVDYYAGAGRWLQANTPSGARVFTTDWDDFPLIYFHNVHNTYLVGLDPTYMHQYDPHIYQTWRSITRGQVQHPSTVIREQFQSQYVLTDRDHVSFFEAASADPGMKLVYRDITAIIFEVSVAP